MSLTDDLVGWLADLEAWSSGHRLLSCDCLDSVVHERRREILMGRKADLIARCQGGLRGPAQVLLERGGQGLA